jgi:hypothetical protein
MGPQRNQIDNLIAEGVWWAMDRKRPEQTEIKAKFMGMSPYRYGQNPLEKRFAQYWQDLNTRPTTATLDYLMDPENRGSPVPALTDREWRVANTLIQWLGSPVGFGFLRDVLESRIRSAIDDELDAQAGCLCPDEKPKILDKILNAIFQV